MSGIVLRPGSSVPFSPDRADHLPDRTYHLKVPAAYEAADIDERVEIEGGRPWYPLDLARLFRAEFRKLVAADPDPEACAPILAEVEAWVEELEAAVRRVSEGNSAEVASAFFEAARIPDRLLAVEGELHQASRAWRTARAQQRAYRQRYGRVAADLYLTGWEGEDDLPEFRRGRQGVPDELMALVPAEHLAAIGDRVGELLRPSAARLKNSPSASSPGSSATPSTPTPATGRTTRRLNGRSPSAPGFSTISDGAASESTPSSS